MKALVDRGRRDPEVRRSAATILSQVDQNDKHAIISEVQRWVQKNVNFQRDPKCLELVQTARYTLSNRFGDCDDQSVLVATLLQAVGIDTRFKVIGREPRSFSHVLVEANDGQKWLAVETIFFGFPLGQIPQARSVMEVL